MSLLTKLTILLKTCEFDLRAHPSNNTESNTTEATPIHFPRIIAWDTSPELHTRRIRRRVKALTDKSNNLTQHMRIRSLRRPKQQHWVGHNWGNVFPFPANDSLKTSLRIDKTRIRKCFHVFTDDSSNLTQNMRIRSLSRPKQQHSLNTTQLMQFPLISHQW
jgi:hypothetical protein